ncbi:MAG: hypothetical protein IPH57_16350 [Saprospiraceae bacterium]|nr:hypothetical protein [Saprospiraceae bacterium]
MFSGCNKDVLIDDNSTGLASYNWTSKEKDFFNFSNQSKISQKANSIMPRNISANMPVLLTTAYNQIANQNENENFVEGLTHTIGIPFWSYSFVYQNAENNEGIVIIPFGFENGTHVEALLVGTKSLQYPDQKMYFKFVFRRDIEQVINTDSIKSRPNFKIEIANFIIDEMAIYNNSNDKFLDFILNNSTNIESNTDTNGNLSLRNDDCIYYEIEFCTYLGDYISGGGNLGDWNNFGDDPNGGWTSPGGGNVFGDSSSDSETGDGDDDDNEEEEYDDPRKSSGGGFGRWWRRVKSEFWGWYSYIMIHCAFMEINPNNKNNQQVSFSNDQQLKLRNDSDWACIVYLEKWCYGNDGWYEEALNMADECAQALANFEFHYGLNLSEEEKEYLTEKMGHGWCDDYGSYYEQAIPLHLMYNLNLKCDINTTFDIEAQKVILGLLENDQLGDDFGVENRTTSEILSDIINSNCGSSNQTEDDFYNSFTEYMAGDPIDWKTATHQQKIDKFMNLFRIYNFTARCTGKESQIPIKNYFKNFPEATWGSNNILTGKVLDRHNKNYFDITLIINFDQLPNNCLRGIPSNAYMNESNPRSIGNGQYALNYTRCALNSYEDVGNISSAFEIVYPKIYDEIYQYYYVFAYDKLCPKK